MTREEALRELMDIRDEATAYPEAVCYVTSEDEDALNMAIEVLQAQTDGDLIRRSDAIDEIKALYEWHDTVTEDRAVDHLKRLPSAEPKTGWIPVSERLPEKDGSYLVCMRWNYRNMDVLMWADGWNCIRRIDGKVDRESEIDVANIIAWMPLPPVYQGE